MPELPECKIMSDYINFNSKGKNFTKLYNVEKGNNPKLFITGNFSVESLSFGKEIRLILSGIKSDPIYVYVFMGMSGNWKYTSTTQWSDTKYIRLRIDDEYENSLLLYGGYLGPKYKIGYPFNSKRGPDPTKDFDKFKENILNNIESKDFDVPIYEILLNQKYFNGIGNYLRSTILYYANDSPFQKASDFIKKNENIIDLCKEIPLMSYKMNGGQLKDWKNPISDDSTEFKNWVFYQKGSSIKDSLGRTFWYDPKWK